MVPVRRMDGALLSSQCETLKGSAPLMKHNNKHMWFRFAIFVVSLFFVRSGSLISIASYFPFRQLYSFAQPSYVH